MHEMYFAFRNFSLYKLYIVSVIYILKKKKKFILEYPLEFSSIMLKSRDVARKYFEQGLSRQGMKLIKPTFDRVVILLPYTLAHPL
jgi:hypothetical protein